VSSYTNSEVDVLQGNGNGTFGTPTVIGGIGSGPEFVSARDISGDGKIDIITANYGTASVSVILGKGSTTSFNTPVSYGISTPSQPYALVAADFFHDGIVDLATINQNAATISLILGNGDGTFGNPFTVGSTGSVPYD